MYELLQRFGFAKIVVSDADIRAQEVVGEHMMHLNRNVSTGRPQRNEAVHWNLNCATTTKMMGYDKKSDVQERLQFRKIYRRGGR